MQSLYLPLQPVEPIREAVRPWKTIRGAHKKSNRKREPHADCQQPHSLYPPHDNREMEGRVREKYQKISGEIENLERTIDRAKNIRDMSKRPS